MSRDKPFIAKTTVLAGVSLTILTVLSVMAAARLFDHPSSILTSQYLYGNDLPIYQLAGEVIRTFWKYDRHLWGYCPFFMAGYPFVQYTSGLVWGFMFILFSWLPMGARAAIFMLGVAAAVPAANYIALGQLAGNSGNSGDTLLNSRRIKVGVPRIQLVGASMGTLAFFLGPGIFYWWMGTVEAILSMLCVLLAYSFFLGWFRKIPGTPYLIRGELSKVSPEFAGLVITGAAALLTHKTGGLCLAVLICVSLPFLRPKLGRLFLLGAAGAFMLVLNSFWIIPLLRFYKNRLEVPRGLWTPPAGGGLIADLFSLHAPAGSLPMLWFLIIAGVLGLRQWFQREKRLAMAYTAGMAIWILVAYIGEHVERLAPIQPRRFLIFVIALVAPLSAMGVKWIWGRLSRFVAIPLFGAILIALVAIPGSYHFLLRFPLLTQVPAPLMDVSGRITRELGPSRVLVEETSGSALGIVPYYGGHFYAMIPFLTGKEVIGGYGQGLSYSWMSLRDGRIMGRPVNSLSETELKNYMDLYNVGGILCFSDAAKSRFDEAAPFLEKVADYGQLRWYKVNREPGFVIGGTGRVTAVVNRIEVHDLKTDGEDVILKYHWDKILRCNPSCNVDQAFLGGDPVPFIKVHKPPSSFTIIMNYEL